MFDVKYNRGQLSNYVKKALLTLGNECGPCNCTRNIESHNLTGPNLARSNVKMWVANLTFYYLNIFCLNPK